MQSVNNLDFESMRSEFACPDSCTTVAYWIGTLSNLRSKMATDEDEACAAMSHQYDVEEQDNLCGYPEYIPSSFRPIAPVTLSYKWSPLPLAIEAVGKPLACHYDTAGRRLLVFSPDFRPEVVIPGNRDAKHFIFLLRETVMRTNHSYPYLLICASPGWSYSSPESIGWSTRRLMRKFGFVYQRRKPRVGIIQKLLRNED